MQEPSRTNSSNKKMLVLALKVLVTAACLWYVSRKIDFGAVAVALKQANWIWLAAALMLYVISKIISAYRLNINFRNIELHIPERDNLRLYWLGMFYNLFLPGSIGGDAYKVILLSRTHQKPVRKLTAAVLLDRFSGLTGLAIILACYGFFVLPAIKWKLLLAAVAILSIIAIYFILKEWLRDFLPGFIPTLLLGILVQGIQVIAVYAILLSLGIHAETSLYIFIFLVSSVASVLPLTIGGLGLREIVFLQGSVYLNLHQETAILVSLLFFFITVLASAVGMIYVFREPPGIRKDKKMPAS